VNGQPNITLIDGHAMPQFGLGVWQTPQDETARVIECALSAGYRAIDTAAIYGNEAGVGEGLKACGISRDDLFITTKLWNEAQGYDSTLKAFDQSMTRLGLDVLDLYLIHWPSPHRGMYVDTWRAMVELKAQGRIRSIGVSNFEPEHLERIIGETGVTPAVNQVELHPRFQQRPLREVHRRLGIHTQSWSPLGQAWTHASRGQLLQDPTVAKVAAKHEKTPAQTIIRWHLENGLIVIPKSVTQSRIRENIDVFNFQLDLNDLQAIAGLDDPNGRMGPHPISADF
jgi:2,5-diketo-D-gluconate reductase A